MKNLTKSFFAALVLSIMATSQAFAEKTIYTEIEINAPAKQVWAVLTNFKDYPNWNPFIKKISGDVAVNTKLKVQIKPADDDAMDFTPRLKVVKPEQELRWLGRVLLPMVFDGEHYFKIEPLTANKVKFIHGEVFSGMLVPFFWGGMEQGTVNGFKAMNVALKAQVEQQVNLHAMK